MKRITPSMLTSLALDLRNGWSIGTFGAIGEFHHVPDDRVCLTPCPDGLEIVTQRGAIRISPSEPLHALAWDSLVGKGRRWRHSMALCGPLQLTAKHTLKVLGKDADAVRPEDRDAWLIDLGIGVGRVRMCVRTENARLVEALAVDTDDPLAVVTAAFALLMEVQPHRVMLSPAGRLEVYQPVPAPDGDSPLGAHTHLLPKLVRLKRPCSALDPIPEGWQPFLTLHPAAPFRPSDDDSHDYDRLADLSFLPLLEEFGMEEDLQVSGTFQAHVRQHGTPENLKIPATRRGRARMHIELLRMAAWGHEGMERFVPADTIKSATDCG
ncbi:hypothetical protein NO263_01920 [Gluconacetobacter entanii]|nr:MULTISPECIES: hypothetical protein [Acetobacteraceae]MCE2580690.1 hypothetical protein [Komagataeibacter sp. FNDCR1]MCW4589346.1 hypothetical protein [Gluconacetobacter entanii]MCW4592977.1 hypothetical protein [Gluconacetobacter entanii]WEQ57632.1 hypothetical protein LV564_17615 [Komagataeibacter nataicola]